RLKPMLLSATALGTSARGTIAPTEACQAGALIAAPHPIRKLKNNSSHGLARPRYAETATAADRTSMKAAAASMSRRRANAYANPPAISASNTIGSVIAACPRVTICGDAPRSTIIQAAPTPWIMPPKLDARVAIHTERKIRYRNGEKADLGRGKGSPVSLLMLYPRCGVAAYSRPRAGTHSQPVRRVRAMVSARRCGG